MRKGSLRAEGKMPSKERLSFDGIPVSVNLSAWIDFSIR
jgi:hypothetical protein